MRAKLERNMQMREIKVQRTDLLDKVMGNREKHVAEYEEAVEGYKQAALEAVDKAMSRLKDRIRDLEAGEVLVLQSVTFDLKVPRNHKKDYDQVIEMLRMSVDDHLLIRSDEFACYVMDDWDWKEDFLELSNTYKNRR